MSLAALLTSMPWLSALLGVALVAIVLGDAFETILVPRRIGRRIRLTRYFYIYSWRFWSFWAAKVRKSSDREAVLGSYGPISLILLIVCWALAMIAAFTLLQSAARGFAGLPPQGLASVLYMSGETFFTLGYGDVTPATMFGRWLSVIEAGMGLGFLATVIGYLPTLYTTFSQRELQVTMFDAHAGSPPTAAEFVRRATHQDAALTDAVLRDWERWSAQVLETHISYPLLAYYRSQHSNQSWLSALVVVLDSSALLIARADGSASTQPKRTFAMARHALVDVTQVFVRHELAVAPDRLPAEQLDRLRVHLAGTTYALPEDAAFAERLRELRLLYEPYAQALAAHMHLELPPWMHPALRRDNWQGGPWDKRLASRFASGQHPDEHF